MKLLPIVSAADTAATEHVMSESTSAQPVNTARTRSITLTDEFERALALLAGGKNLFLTGKAGTGKSTLIRYFMSTTTRGVVVVAPTGIAALNVEGYTIHRLFGFTPTTTVEQVESQSYRPGLSIKVLKTLRTLIIDEASMVRADIFDMVVLALEKFGPQPGTPRGGVQIVLVGDLFQLPPIVDPSLEDYFSTRYASPYFFSADRFSREDFPTVQLTTVFRQLGDDTLTSMLNAIREGVLAAKVQEDLQRRTVPGFVAPDDEFWLTLAPTNRIVAARNRDRLNKLVGDEYSHRAEQTGDLLGFDPPVEDDLRYKVGAQIMMLSNDPGRRWANGTLGRIFAVDQGGETVVGVEFRDGTRCSVEPYTWEVTKPVVHNGSIRHERIGHYTQLPFKLAWAITIHKSQGQTLDRLIVDFSGGAFAYGQVYVALSRCTSMKGLILERPIRPKELKVDRRVLRFLAETTEQVGLHRRCAVSVLTVGEESRFDRPRPIEIAVAFEDGGTVSTLVNPQRDLGDAKAAYSISVEDILLAPTLAEAWPAISRVVEGHTPVGVGIDRTLELIDSELKRLECMVSLPLGISLPNDAADPGQVWRTARDLAMESMRVFQLHALDDPATTTFAAVDSAESDGSEPGYLLTRDYSARLPSVQMMPTMVSVLSLSRAISEVVLQDTSVTKVSAPQDLHVFGGDGDLVKEGIASQIRSAIERASSLPPRLRDRIRQVELRFGFELQTSNQSWCGENINSVLIAGAKVCFSGTATTASGAELDRNAMEKLAADHGLAPVGSVTKRKCDVLIVAEIGTQSRKATTAKKFEKPIFSADEFFGWIDRLS